MRNFSKKIITSVLTLVLTVVALGTGVFAWFSMNTKTSATGLNGSAEAATGGFYISTTGTAGTWLNTVNLETISNGGFKVQGDVFTDLTSKDGIVINKIDLDDPLNEMADYINSAATGYMEFPLYFLTGSDYKKVSITKLEFVSHGLTSWSAEKDILPGLDGRAVTVGDMMSSDIINALRVSFQEMNWDAQDGAGATTANTAIIFENVASADNMGVNPKVFGNTNGFNTIAQNFAVKYFNAVNNDTLVTMADTRDGSLDIPVLAGGVTNEELLSTFLLSSPAAIRGDLDEAFEFGGMVMVRVWLEGWDQEAFNALFGGEVTINMTFEVSQ